MLQGPSGRNVTMVRSILAMVLAVAPWCNAMADRNSLKELPTTELVDLVVGVLPPDGFEHVGWDYLVSNPMLSWQTDGTETMRPGVTRREALARVRVGGIESRVLRRNWEELAWTFTLWSFGNPRFGPERLEIKPGGSNPKDVCFGVNFTGCDFPIERIIVDGKNQLDAHFECTPPGVFASDIVKVYQISTPQKKPSLLVYVSSGGSGGTSASIMIRPLKERNRICNGEP